MSIMWKYLDKRAAVIRALKDYSSMKFIIDNTDREIKEVQDQAVSVASPSLSGMPKVHNPQAGEDRIIRALDEIDVLKERYRQAVEYMDWFQPAWDFLTDDERYVLETFYTDEDTGYMCIRTSIVKKNRILWDEIEYIPEAEYIERIKRKKPEKGDVIYTREGAILGIAAIIDRDCNVALGQRSMLLSPDKTVCLPEFLSVAMNFDSFLNKVLEGVMGSASPHINVGDIRAYNIMLPPIEVQKEFARYMEAIDKSKLAVTACMDKVKELKAALMQEYFG